jgi:hypothetical protein
MSNQPFLNNLWRWKCGLPELEIGKPQTPKTSPVTFAELRRTEWSVKFENLMRNRLIMGALRYGRLGAANKPKYNRVDSMIKRLSKY